MTLLPEATSSRAIRALGKFFGTADRDDVLLVYFSGHGKLDHSGRLHLCMQDTESTDLLSTAVSSARIKEFADASRARNVVIVLDCCYAGAFRGADLGDAVAGPGRYVLTSCRGTQLANDATVDNGTSFFTQHLVDGLVEAAADQDEDGYVTFSDLYAYVDRRLREAGKQIPQRRVDGDGDVPLARRPLPARAEVTGTVQPQSGHTETIHPSQPQEQPGSGSPPGSSLAGQGATVQDTTPAPAGPRTGRARRGVMVAAGAAAIAIAAGVVVAVVLLSGGSGGNSGSTAGTGGISSGSWVASRPWRLRVDDRISGQDNGCTVRLTDTHSGSAIPLPKTPSGKLHVPDSPGRVLPVASQRPGVCCSASGRPGERQAAARLGPTGRQRRLYRTCPGGRAGDGQQHGVHDHSQGPYQRAGDQLPTCAAGKGQQHRRARCRWAPGGLPE